MRCLDPLRCEAIEAMGVAFEITTFAMACGPLWSTTWTVLDLGEASNQADD
jgi:hypothetical protein